MGKEIKMAEFKIIETQEALDEIIAARLQREKDKTAKVEEGLKEEIEALKKTLAESQSKFEEQEKEIAGHNDEVAKLTAEISGYKLKAIKHQIANDNGLPYELADRLTGDDEETLKQDAENLKRYFNQTKTAPPLATAEVPPSNDKKSAYRELAKKLERN